MKKLRHTHRYRIIFARTCPKCLGFKTINLTDGTVKICPKCGGKGEID